MEDFNNWMEDMTQEFENDFLGQKKRELNDILKENNVYELKN